MFSFNFAKNNFISMVQNRIKSEIFLSKKWFLDIFILNHFRHSQLSLKSPLGKRVYSANHTSFEICFPNYSYKQRYGYLCWVQLSHYYMSTFKQLTLYLRRKKKQLSFHCKFACIVLDVYIILGVCIFF